MRTIELVRLIENVDGSPSFRRSVRVEKKGDPPRKKIRIIYEPNAAMAEIHGLIRKWLRSQKRFPSYLPPSPFANVLPHCRNTYFYQIDLWNAYGVTTIEKLLKAFRKYGVYWELGAEEHLSRILRDYCMSREGGLATGGPASTDLFNVCAAMLFDRGIWRYCRAEEITYTRFVDDLTFSSRFPYTIGRRRRESIRSWIEYAGFSLSHRKSQVRKDIAGGAVSITGLKLEGNSRIFASEQYLVKLRGLLHMALQGAPVDFDEVNGYMSVFWSPFGGRIANPHLNKTERHILELYERCRKVMNCT